MMNRRQRRAQGERASPALDKTMLQPSDPKLMRSKICLLDPSFLQKVLNLDGTIALRMAGWPKDGQLVGIAIVKTDQGARIMLTVHHPSFPMRLPGALPVPFEIRFEAKEIESPFPPLEDEDAEPSVEARAATAGLVLAR